jgi:hypothetical protein
MIDTSPPLDALAEALRVLDTATLYGFDVRRHIRPRWQGVNPRWPGTLVDFP